MHYLQVNYLMDKIMPNVQNGSTFKVISAVARQTWGYRRDCHDVSFSEFMDMTGIRNKTTLSNAIQDAIDLGHIAREEWSNSFSYRMVHNPLAITNGTETVPVDEENGTETVPLDGTETVPIREQNGTETVPPSYKVKKESKEKGKEDNPFPFRPNPVTPAVVPEVERRIDEILAACDFRRGTPAHLNRAENAAAQLQDVTPEEIKARYGRASPNGLWNWYRDDWRGKKGEPPTPEKIVETIYYKRETATSGGQTTEEIISQAVDEAYEAMNNGNI